MIEDKGKSELNYIKSVVSSHKSKESLDNLLKLWYASKHNELERLVEPRDLYICQGEIRMINKLLQLKDTLHNAEAK